MASTSGQSGHLAAGVRRAVVAELPHDWARREVMREWSIWLGDHTAGSREAPPGGLLSARAGLVNDILCLRWLGYLDRKPGGCATPTERLSTREAHRVSAWSFVAILGEMGDVGADGAASDLEKRLRRWGPTSTFSVSDDGLEVMARAPTGGRRPPIVRCLHESMFTGRWLLCPTSSGIHEQITRHATLRTDINPPVHQIGDIRRVPCPCGGHIGGRGQIWRAYLWPRRDRRAEVGASAALVDGLRTTFEIAEVELALIKPLDGERLAVEIAGAVFPAAASGRTRLFDAFERADEIARDLGYAIATPFQPEDEQRATPEPVRGPSLEAEVPS
jgi:hypothetical protein